MVFGSRSGPDERSVQFSVPDTGNTAVPPTAPNPPSLDTSADCANVGHTMETWTWGSLVAIAPPLIDTPSSPAGAAKRTSTLVDAVSTRPPRRQISTAGWISPT